MSAWRSYAISTVFQVSLIRVLHLHMRRCQPPGLWSLAHTSCQVVVALPSPQEKRPPQMLENPGAVAPEVPTLMYPKANPEKETAAAAAARATTTGSESGSHEPQELRQEPLTPDEAKPLMELSYDKLVYAVGTKTGTFGVPGVREHCYMLKVMVVLMVVMVFCHGVCGCCFRDRWWWWWWSVNWLLLVMGRFRSLNVVRFCHPS